VGVAAAGHGAADTDGDVVMADSGGGDGGGGGHGALQASGAAGQTPTAHRGEGDRDVAGTPPSRPPAPPSFPLADLPLYVMRLSTIVERCGLAGDAAGRAKAAEEELAAGTPGHLAQAVEAAEAAADGAVLRLLAAAFGGLLRLASPRLLDVLLAEPVWPCLITALEYEGERVRLGGGCGAVDGGWGGDGSHSLAAAAAASSTSSSPTSSAVSATALPMTVDSPPPGGDASMRVVEREGVEPDRPSDGEASDDEGAGDSSPPRSGRRRRSPSPAAAGPGGR